MNEIELRGVPTVFVASDEFVDAAAGQARALGSNAPVVFVAHPIQDRSDDEIRDLADGAFEELVAKLVEEK